MTVRLSNTLYQFLSGLRRDTQEFAETFQKLKILPNKDLKGEVTIK